MDERLYHDLPKQGWLSLAEAELLWKTAKQTKGPILEVGCYYGKSTCLLAALGRPIYAVDPFSDFDDCDFSGAKIKEGFLMNLRARDIYNVTLFHERIEDWEPRPVGFAYLDGNHTYDGTKQQIRKAKECRPKAIGIHDVNDTGEGIVVKQAAKGMLGPWTNRVERLAVWLDSASPFA